MKTNLKVLPYLLVNIIAFYLLPAISKDTGSAILIMLIGIPVILYELTECNFSYKSIMRGREI